MGFPVSEDLTFLGEKLCFWWYFAIGSITVWVIILCTHLYFEGLLSFLPKTDYRRYRICFSEWARSCFGSKIWLADWFLVTAYRHHLFSSYIQSIFLKINYKLHLEKKIYTYIYMFLCQYSDIRISAKADSQNLEDLMANNLLMKWNILKLCNS